MRRFSELTPREKFLVGFFLLLVLLILMNWRDFSRRLKDGLEKWKPKTEQVQPV